jgi:type IV secretion system protein TrbG
MNKSFFIATLSALLTCSAYASGDLADKYFTGKNPELNSHERKAIEISNKWSEGTDSDLHPMAGSNGSVKYLYGVQRPSIVCAVLQVCDVALQPGEQVNSINIGDSTRWSVEPAITGVPPNEIQHLIIKPMDVGLETSLVVTTNRRAYHLRLRSHRSEYMPHIAFTYPEDSMAKWDEIRRKQLRERTERTIPDTGEYLGNLNFDYELIGSAKWKPVRVYNDGKKTILEMPKALETSEAPTLLILRNDSETLGDEETAIVNYRIQANRYIVDTVFDRAILISGVGTNQQRITITRGQK